MKIGILTFHNTTNYGAALQAYALQQKFMQLGAECDIVDYHCASIEQREAVVTPKYNGGIYAFACAWKDYIHKHSKYKVLKSFIDRNMKLSSISYSKKNIKEANHAYDKFVVGSDMVWELGITGCDTTYMLDFADYSKKYSYAASLGVDKIADGHIATVKNNLETFSQISVRESHGKSVLENIISKDIRVDVDPTLLHNGDFWSRICEYEENMPQEYILLYFLDGRGVMLDVARKISVEKSLPIVLLSDVDVAIDGVKVVRNCSVGEFLGWIKKATLVITGSYHGMLFSMNFNTQFMYYNRANSSRMESIAQYGNVQNRRIVDENIFPDDRIDFSEVNPLLENMRTGSIEYLEKIVTNKL